MQHDPTRLAERYENRLYPYDPSHLTCRWWALPGRILVGGSIIDEADYQHLVSAYAVTHVLNVEVEHGDSGKGIPPDRLCETQVADDGTPFHEPTLQAALVFAQQIFNYPDCCLYLHCQMGGSRSPGFAYAVMRYVFGMAPQQALDELNRGFPHGEGHDYGYHPVHQSYIAGVERFITARRP